MTVCAFVRVRARIKVWLRKLCSEVKYDVKYRNAFACKLQISSPYKITNSLLLYKYKG